MGDNNQFLKQRGTFRSDFMELFDAKVENILGLIADMQQELQAEKRIIGKIISYDRGAEEIQSEPQIVIPITDCDEFEFGENNQIDQQGVLEMPHSIAKFESRSEKLELMREHPCNTIEESDFLIEETTQMQAQKVFDEMLDSEMKVLCVTATVEMKTDIGDEVYEGSILQKQKVSGEINDKLDETQFAELVRRLNPGKALKSASNFDALQRFALSFNSLERVTCAQYLHICANENHFNRFVHDHARVQWREEPPGHSKYLCAAYYSKPLNLNTLLSLFSEYDSPRSVSCSIQIIFGKLMHIHMETSRRFVTMFVGSAMGESDLWLLNINGVAMVETDLKIRDQINGGPIFPKSIICDGMVGLETKFWEIAQKVQKGKFSNWVRWMKPMEDGGSAYDIEFIPSSFLDEAYQRRLSAHLYVVRVLWRVNDVTVLYYFKPKGMTTTSLAYLSEMKNNEIDLVFDPGGLEIFKVEDKWGNDLCFKYFPCIFWKPVGVVGAITPCNFLLAMITPKIVPILASGCNVIESSRLTPLTALAAAKLAIQAGIPCGELNEVVGNTFGIGDVLLQSPQKVSGDIQALYYGHNTSSLQVLPSAGVLWNLATFKEVKGNSVEENTVLILLALCNSRTTVAHENSIGCLCSLVKRDDDFKLQVAIEGRFVTLKDI